MFSCCHQSGRINELKKAGFWNLDEDYFTSNLVLNYYYNSPISRSSISPNFEIPAEVEGDPLLQRIYAGLCTFGEIDFSDATLNSRVLVENAISAKWATHLHSHMPMVFIASQVRAISTVGKSGSKPAVDFLLNGRGQFAVEFALNGYELKEKILKFESGHNMEWRSKYAIVNIITKSKEIAFGDKMRKIRSNALI